MSGTEYLFKRKIVRDTLKVSVITPHQQNLLTKHENTTTSVARDVIRSARSDRLSYAVGAEAEGLAIVVIGPLKDTPAFIGVEGDGLWTKDMFSDGLCVTGEVMEDAKRCVPSVTVTDGAEDAEVSLEKSYGLGLGVEGAGGSLGAAGALSLAA